MLKLAAAILKLPFYAVGLIAAAIAILCVLYVTMIDAFVEPAKPPRRQA